MQKSNNDNSNIVSVIRWSEENDTFVWKYPEENFSYGSQLIVNESQEALFFKNGQALDLFGAGRYTLETQQLPLLNKIYKSSSDGDSTFQSQVYFINKTEQTAVKWGTPDKIRFIDPLTGVPLEIGASGSLNIAVMNSRNLILKLVGTMRGIAWNDKVGFAKSLSEGFRPFIINAIKSNLPKVITDIAIDILEIDTHLDVISERLLETVKEEFNDYGLSIGKFYITNVVLPEDDINFKRIRELHTITLRTRLTQAEAMVKTAQAQSMAQYRIAEEQSAASIEFARRDTELQKKMTEVEIAKWEAQKRTIEADAEAKVIRTEGLAEAEVMHAKGYTEKDVLQAEVQKALAEGIANMVPNSVSGSSGSLSGDVVNIGLGMAMANALSPQIGGIFKGMNGQSGNNDNSINTIQKNNIVAAWSCMCGEMGNTGNFCSNCGKERNK